MSESIKINNETLTYNKIWYIDQNNGNDTSGDGSEGNPFQTIQKGIDSITQNDQQIYILKGDYYLDQKQSPIFTREYGQIIDIGFDINIIGNGLETIINADYQSYEFSYVIQRLNHQISIQNLIFKINNNTINTPNGSSCIISDGSDPQYFSNIVFDMVGSGDHRLIYKNYSSSLTFEQCIFNFKQDNTNNWVGHKNNQTPSVFNNCIVCNMSHTYGIYNSDMSYTPFTEWNYSIIQNSDETFYAWTNNNCQIIDNITFDEDYNITSDNWENQGDPSILNPDGTQSNIGVYGGPYQWGDWFKLLLEQSSNYYTFDGGSINPLQITSLTKEDFDNDGFDTKLITNDNINLFQDYNFLSLNSKLQVDGILNKYDPIITNNLIKSKFININNITFDYTSNNMNIGILTSFDNINWNYYNGSDFIIEDINNPTNLNTITEIESLFTNYDSFNLDELYFQIIIDPIDDTSSFTLNSIDLDIINDSQLKILLSNEDNVWYGLNPSNELINIDINNMEDIYNYGLSIDKINDIHNSDQNFWNNFQGGTNKIKLQYYLQINDSQEMIELDTLSLQVDINGTWKLQQPFNTETNI